MHPCGSLLFRPWTTLDGYWPLQTGFEMLWPSRLTADRCMRISLLFFTSFCISDNVCGPVAPLIGSCYTQQSYDTRGTTLRWSAAYKWFPLALHCSWVRLQCASGLQNMTTHHLPHSLAQSRQLPGIDFSFPFSLSLSHTVFYFFPHDCLFQGGLLTIHWFNRQKINPISSKSAFSELISWHLDSPKRWKNTGLSVSRTHIYRKVLHLLVFWKFISNWRKVHWVGWLFSFVK